MKETTAAGKMLRGAVLLSLAAIVTKLLGTLQKIPLQNIGGDGVFGIYNTVYPFYTLLLTLATAGFPVAVSRFVAEREAAGNRAGAAEVLRLSGMVMLTLGCAGGLGMYFGAPLLAHWIGNQQLVPALRCAAPALFFVPASAALRGYFQGLQDMMPTAVSQVMEQAIRVGVMIVLLLTYTAAGASDSTVAAGAMIGSAAGGLAGLGVMLLYWQKHRRSTEVISWERDRSGWRDSQEDTLSKPIAGGRRQSEGEPRDVEARGGRLLKQLLAYAIPICLAALAVPLMGLVDTFTLPRLLKQGGWDELGSMIQVGIYNRGIPLVQLVTMLASSLSVLFIPAMAEFKFRGDQGSIESHSRLALRWFWLIGLAASAGLAVLAEPINIMLYKDAAGTDAMQWIALTAAPGTMLALTAALLQGLGTVRAPALYLAGAAALKIVLNLLLVPQLGITGAAIAGVAAYSLAAALSLALLVKTTALRLRLADAVLKPALLVAALALAVLALRWLADAAGLGPGRAIAAAESLLGVFLGAAVFAAGVVRLRLMTGPEIEALPGIGPKLARLLRKIRLLPPR
ncbi:oligosaccharide flippase family protein [Paenibacillus sp. YPG26]|uniref:putative polysaccharide biosynthesis protein n=1 Tax=Paenibacillus sp. YPG26 TaxID=2878915 RepID=UPI002041A1FB|nr:oligosaccharide flippase family protein [Paenibacillus sp. YPG26]USB33310.1 oligosaccharide flippase family protein [Paenibacillus sp. YPG26]